MATFQFSAKYKAAITARFPTREGLTQYIADSQADDKAPGLLWVLDTGGVRLRLYVTDEEARADENWSGDLFELDATCIFADVEADSLAEAKEKLLSRFRKRAKGEEVWTFFESDLRDANFAMRLDQKAVKKDSNWSELRVVG